MQTGKKQRGGRLTSGHPSQGEEIDPCGLDPGKWPHQPKTNELDPLYQMLKRPSPTKYGGNLGGFMAATCKLRKIPQFSGPLDGLHPAVNFQLGIYIFCVPLHGADGHHQLIGHLFVGQPLGNQLQDFEFAV